ncbi:hypothetical protein PMAYCL1PPCAC_24557, partial [Pristionchus mayeri]
DVDGEETEPLRLPATDDRETRRRQAEQWSGLSWYPLVSGWIHEHRPRADGGVRRWTTAGEVRRRLPPWQQRPLHLDPSTIKAYAESGSINDLSSFNLLSLSPSLHLSLLSSLSSLPSLRILPLITVPLLAIGKHDSPSFASSDHVDCLARVMQSPVFHYRSERSDQRKISRFPFPLLFPSVCYVYTVTVISRINFKYG